VPATPSAFGGTSRPPVTTGLRPGYTGFTPAAKPLPPAPPPPAPLPPPPAAWAPASAAPTPLAPVATRGTIAPRFAARLAEEAARAQGASSSPTAPAQAQPGAPATPAPAPFGSALAQHAAARQEEAIELPPAFAPTAPVELDPLPPPPPAFAPVPVPATPVSAPIVAVPEPYIPPSIAANRASVFAPPPAPTAAPVPTPGPAELASDFAAPSPPGPVASPAPAIGSGGTAMPSPPADDVAAALDAAEERRAGPPTLASMLPEDAGDWPPRRIRKRPVEAAAPAGEVELVDRTKDPRFLREAKSGARWRKPWVRAVLGATLVVLVAAAVGQLAWPQRDMLAARWPASRPAWNWLCEQAGCRIEAPRAIASLALDGSSLTRTDTEHVLLFAADLHNRSDHEVRMPSFDLTFMDLNGEIVARKVLSPEQVGIRQPALPPEGDLHVHARLQVGALPASGFQADLFYP
jgi:hypothetical protein